MAQELLTAAIRAKLLENGSRSAAGENIDPTPVVKLFMPEGGATWLLTELDPANQDIAFGLCDMGLGVPELGYISLNELAGLRTPQLRLPVERDLYIRLTKPLSVYAAKAHAAGYITTSF